MARVACELGVAAAVAALVSLAAADDRTAIRVEYAADEGCPDARAFVAEVMARTPHARLAGAKEEAREFRVDVHRTGGKIAGRMKILSGGARDVDGDKCSEVVSALALITALTIDPAASTAPSSSLVIAPPGDATDAGATDDTTLRPPPAPRAPPIAIEIPKPPILAPIGPPQAPRIAAGGDFTLAIGVAPRVLVGGSAFFELGSRHAKGAVARASIGYATTGPFTTGSGGALFTAATGRIEACPLALSIGEIASLFPCVGFAGGALRGQGIERGAIVEPRQAVIPWLAADLLGRFRLDLGSSLTLELAGGPELPFVRHTFVFEDPTETIHEIPTVTWAIASGLGVRFP